jgi:septal ring factor EnvC (AmiA/AmiB activator)
MSRETLVRLGRRAIVLAATLAVVGIAVGTVQVAAEWRAAAAPLDVAPAGMTTIADDFAAETGRSEDLATQVDGVARQIGELQTALIEANDSVDGDADAAADLQARLDAAKSKLTAMQEQLKAAQDRLEQLNRAAARQAALNRAAASQAKVSRSSGGEDHEDEDKEEHDDD